MLRNTQLIVAGKLRLTIYCSGRNLRPMPSIKKTPPADHPLRAWRIQHGLSQDRLAVRVDTSKATISRVEAGLLDPTFALLRRIIAATGGAVTAEAIIAWKPPPATKAGSPAQLRSRKGAACPSAT
jgi:DNA-binding XRE family transcriptional regulator